MTTKKRRRRTSRLLPKTLRPKDNDMTVAWLPIGMKGSGAGRAIPRMIGGWKSIEITGNDVNLKHLGKVRNLVIRNFRIYTDNGGETLYIEGK
jgi:hypothetical protein